MAPPKPCVHAGLQHKTSSYAAIAGFHRPNADRRLAATTKSGRNPLKIGGIDNDSLELGVEKSAQRLAAAFPAPLVLPDDHLAIDPRNPPQSFRSWLLEEQRNKPTKKRKTIYVASVPEVTQAVKHMNTWLKPDLSGRRRSKINTATYTTKPLLAEEFVDYLGAFYHGMSVKTFPQRLQYVPWSEKGDAGTAKYIGLAMGDLCVRIRVRPSPDGLFSGQLNLEDVLDVAIDLLPGDAYAIVLLIDHDMYEDEDDDFCCGRAYGGSRVCVVSSARYHPVLDQLEGVDYNHIWPASHCKSYVDDICKMHGVELSSLAAQVPLTENSYLWPAIKAAEAANKSMKSDPHRGLWLSRLVRTVSHELGHCLGMGHCNYYACVMQGTASMLEDLRQPPYLCPVCVGKVSHAVAWELHGRNELQMQTYKNERYEALLNVCERWQSIGMFAAYSAWLRTMLKQSP